MTWTRAHGRAAELGALVAVATAPPDELPLGVQAPPHAEAGDERRADGRFAKGTRTAQSKGGKARKEGTALASRLGLSALSAEDGFAPYKKAAVTFKRVHCASLAASVGGGICGSGPSSIVASAALALAASRYLYDTANGDAGKLAQAARLADSSRTALLTAHELAAREAQARAASQSHVNPFLVPE